MRRVLSVCAVLSLLPGAFASCNGGESPDDLGGEAGENSGGTGAGGSGGKPGANTGGRATGGGKPGTGSGGRATGGAVGSGGKPEGRSGGAAGEPGTGGFGGAPFTGCPEGQQDNDGDEVCEPACEANSCGGHGTCDDSQGTIECACDEPYGTDNCSVCFLPLLIDDSFDDGNLATGGPNATNGGFELRENRVSPVGVSMEENGITRIFIPSEVAGGAEPNVGINSATGFNALENGVTVLTEIARTDAPLFQGLVVSVHPNRAHYESSDGLWLATFANSPNDGGDENRVVLRNRNSQPFQGSPHPFTQSEMLDGFEVLLGANADGWSYQVDGLGPNPLQASGTYPDGTTFADLVDPTADEESFVSVAVQSRTNSPSSLTMEVARVRVFSGTCAPGDRPSPSP